MLFHNWIFAVFFVVVFSIHLITRGTKLGVPWLLFCSYVFYGWWNWHYLFLIAYITLMDYSCMRMMGVWSHRKFFAVLPIINNIGLLIFFKYARFIVENINEIFAFLSSGMVLPVPDVVLPVGISFFVFQSMSYTIDHYRGAIKEEKNLIQYASFIAFFPQLVAGPIERASNLLPQLRLQSPLKYNDFSIGISLFIVGLFKKIALADYLALYVDNVYSVPELYEAPALLLATFAFAWQIYFDFSGYTDMARGLARILGIKLAINFNNPYLADGLGEFWQRWHISLSRWFKDYIYISLGGNRSGNFRTCCNIFFTMLLSGLWHGAAWTFVLWGIIHAAGRIATLQLEKTTFYKNHIPRCIKQGCTFLFVCFCWIFFRANSFGDACTVIQRLFARNCIDPRFPLIMGGMILLIWIYQRVHESPFHYLLAKRPVRIFCVAAMLIYLMLFGNATNQPFIYFQF